MNLSNYRLPDGKSTKDVRVYTKAWDKLVATAERFFPGYRVSAMNPGIRLTKWGKTPAGNYKADDTIILSVASILALQEGEKARKKRLKKALDRQGEIL